MSLNHASHPCRALDLERDLMRDAMTYGPLTGRYVARREEIARMEAEARLDEAVRSAGPQSRSLALHRLGVAFVALGLRLQGLTPPPTPHSRSSGRVAGA